MLDQKTNPKVSEAVAADVVLEARDIVRKYSGTTALRGVTFRVRRNQVNVLIGENGAGKSTLMRILAGAEAPTSGQVLIEGRPVTLHSTRDAAKYGIAMVYQELNVLPNLNLAENIFAGREICAWFGAVNSRKQHSASSEALRRLGSAMSTRAIAGRLPLGCQQLVELARSLAHDAQVLILDEPTSALSRTETLTLFRAIEDLKTRGVSIVYISHRLNELLQLGDFFTVLRDGRIVGEAPRAEVDRRWIVECMTGRYAQNLPATTPLPATEEVLRTIHLSLKVSTPDGATRPLLGGVSFSAFAGEVVGIYGLLGSGRTELLETLAGLRSSASGEIVVRGCFLRSGSVLRAAQQGIALVPEDRLRDSLIPSLSIRENISLAALDAVTTGIFVSRKKELKRVRDLAMSLNLKAVDLELPVTSLSGGNQQKVVLARCLMRSPSILLLDEPTRGVDVGAKYEIHRILRGLAANGICVIFTSSEIEETQSLADRILVLSGGRIAASFQAGEASEEALFAAACSHFATQGTPQ